MEGEPLLASTKLKQSTKSELCNYETFSVVNRILNETTSQLEDIGFSYSSHILAATFR
jgi:hypothetical protein